MKIGSKAKLDFQDSFRQHIAPVWQSTLGIVALSRGHATVSLHSPPLDAQLSNVLAAFPLPLPNITNATTITISAMTAATIKVIDISAFLSGMFNLSCQEYIKILKILIFKIATRLSDYYGYLQQHTLPEGTSS